jgi:hypothetical protein
LLVAWEVLFCRTNKAEGSSAAARGASHQQASQAWSCVFIAIINNSNSSLGDPNNNNATSDSRENISEIN